MADDEALWTSLQEVAQQLDDPFGSYKAPCAEDYGLMAKAAASIRALSVEEKQPVAVKADAVEAFRAWFFNHTGKRIFERNAQKAIDTILAAAPPAIAELEAEARRKALEKAAEVAEAKAQQWYSHRQTDAWHACMDAAAAIRALIPNGREG